MLDGEIVLFDAEGRQDFDALGQRIHPAASRVAMLAEQTPTRFIAFDLLAVDDEVLLELPQAERRDRLAALIDKPVDLTPATEDPAEAEPWLHDAEGVIAKRQDARYCPGERVGHDEDQARPHDRRGGHGLAAGQGGGDARLGDHRALRRAGRAARGRPLLRLRRQGEARAARRGSRPYETGERGTGEPSRWNNERELEWVALRPELVIEVTFDHVSNNRIRHGTKVKRWRDDKPPEACTTDQLLHDRNYGC